MRKRDYIILYVASLAIYFGLLAIQHSPAYFDAEYYYVQGIQLATGKGFFEPFLWNYLNAPAQLPNTAFLYWMPLTSLVASLGMVISGSTSYIAAAAPLILLAGFVPVLTAYMATKLSTLRFAGWYAGILAIIGGWFLPYVTQTDMYYLYMLCGGFFFLFVMNMWGEEKSWMKSWFGYLLLGDIAGLMHLARADGILWAGAALGVVWIPFIFRKAHFSGEVLKIKNGILRSVEVAGGYLILMGAWYVRNMQLFGRLMPPDNGRNLFLTEYNDIFSFPSSVITLQRWWASGIGKILSARLDSLLVDVGTLVGISGGVILAAFMVIGILRLGKLPVMPYLAFLIICGVAVMSFLFPFAGQRGGFFHSVTAFQPILLAVTPVGIDAAIQFGVRKRNWISSRSWKMFGSAIMGIFLLVTAYVMYSRILVPKNNHALWDEGQNNYQAVNEILVTLSGDTTSVVMLVDPPGFFLATGRSAIVTPQGNFASVLAAAQEYDAKYLVLEQKHLTSGLKELFNSKEPVPGFTLLGVDGATKFYKLEPSGE